MASSGLKLRSIALGVGLLALVGGVLALAGYAAVMSSELRLERRENEKSREEVYLLQRLGDAAQGCKERGGTLLNTPFGAHCRVPFSDAGRACTDMRECLGGV